MLRKRRVFLQRVLGGKEELTAPVTTATLLGLMVVEQRRLESTRDERVSSCESFGLCFRLQYLMSAVDSSYLT